MKLSSLFTFVLLSVCGNLFAQLPVPDDEKKDYDSKKMFQVLPEFAVNFAGADLAKRFQGFSSLGLAVGYKTYNNLTFNVGFNTLFGKKVLESNMLDYLLGPSKELLDAKGNFATVKYSMRGTQVNFKAGKIFSIEKNKNNGIWIQGGLAYLATRIRMEYQKNFVPQLDNNMYKGYDRYNGGVGFTGSFGYHHITANNTVSYFLNYNFTAVSARNLRGYQFDLMQYTPNKSSHVVSGLSVGIILPIKAKSKKQESFYN